MRDWRIFHDFYWNYPKASLCFRFLGFQCHRNLLGYKWKLNVNWSVVKNLHEGPKTVKTFIKFERLNCRKAMPNKWFRCRGKTTIISFNRCENRPRPPWQQSQKRLRRDSSIGRSGQSGDWTDQWGRHAYHRHGGPLPRV